MDRRAWLMALFITIVSTTGCDSGKKKAVAVPVKGSVMIDGKPLAEGEISFLVSNEAPTTFPIKDGAYSGNANVGKNKVEVRAFKDGPPLSTDPEKKPTKLNYLPERFGISSQLTAEVTAGGTNDFKFEVSAR
ncbi:hypothetical protein [Zavarzinella formosa]|uniref:hypothetical protein n=1 Tax=Zavarzinella formosa TaxID=360055 RepID=UPI000310AE45|nr:hypothetical protein [Zavarzinella formosa]